MTDSINKLLDQHLYFTNKANVKSANLVMREIINELLVLIADRPAVAASATPVLEPLELQAITPEDELVARDPPHKARRKD